MQCKCCYVTGDLPFKVSVVSIPLPGTGSFFLTFFSYTSFLNFFTLTALRIYPGACASEGMVLRIYLVGLLTIDLTINIPVVVYLFMVVQLTFDFEVQLLRSIS